MMWTFGRENERISIGRKADSSAVVVISADESPRAYPFKDSTARDSFQADMEAFLLRTGWTLMKYSPERRLGRDRRGFPRLRERRRWWTDGDDVWTSMVERRHFSPSSQT
jgi:hypothetical protein